MPHSTRKLPADLQAAMLKSDKPGPAIGKRRRRAATEAPNIPAWYPLPVTAWWEGQNSAAYHVRGSVAARYLLLAEDAEALHRLRCEHRGSEDRDQVDVGGGPVQ